MFMSEFQSRQSGVLDNKHYRRQKIRPTKVLSRKFTINHRENPKHRINFGANKTNKSKPVIL